MAESAFQIQYRQEFVAGFEQRQSLVRDTVTTEAVIKGNQATFLVADSGGATAVTRGLNGLIPGRTDNLNQKTATLVEWHDLAKKTDFNIFASQGDGRAIMQQSTMTVMNRRIDQDIINELNTSTVNTGAAVAATLSLIVYAQTILGNNQVPLDNNISALITPAFRGYLIQVKEFNNVNYVNNKPLTDQAQTFNWLGVNWIVHPNLPGAGTNAEKCFMFHKTAIGQAIDVKGIDHEIDYNKEQAYSFARASFNMGSKVLQGSGIVVMNHDGSGFAAA